MTQDVTYSVQYCADRLRLWVHASTGETVGRFNVRTGIDIHTTLEAQLKGASQCLYCTRGIPTPLDFSFFCETALTLWGITIDVTKITLLT